MDNERLAESQRSRWTSAEHYVTALARRRSQRSRWTSAEHYVTALARRRTARRARMPRRSTEPEAPRFSLSTLPFAALLGALAILSIAIMIAAFPGFQPQHKTLEVEHEQGVAPRGWFQEAQRDFHR